MSRFAVPSSSPTPIRTEKFESKAFVLPPICPQRDFAFRSKALLDTPPEKAMRMHKFACSLPIEDTNPNLLKKEEDLSDDEGTLIMKSPNPYSCQQQMPKLLRNQELLKYLDSEVAKLKPSVVRAPASVTDLCNAAPKSQIPERYEETLACALDFSVPEHRHVKMQSEKDKETPFTPRTQSLIENAKCERIRDEWRRVRSETAKEITSAAVALSIQKPLYRDYCRCVRVMQHYSCELPRWQHVMTRESGDPCAMPPLYLSDIPKVTGWRFYNFSISLSVATKIVLRKESAKGRAMSPTGMVPVGEGTSSSAPTDPDPCIDVVDVIHHLYPLYPIGALKVSINAWHQQLVAETRERCKTRIESLPPEETMKTANIFHLLVNGEGDGRRVHKDAFLSRMPKGERNVHAQLAAFSVLFDSFCRVNSDCSNLLPEFAKKSREGRKGRMSIHRKSTVTPEQVPLLSPNEPYMDLECLANALYPPDDVQYL